MNALTLARSGSRGLLYLCLAVTVGAAAGCSSSGSDSQSTAPPSSAVGSDTASNLAAGAAASTAPPSSAIGTDTASNKLALDSGGGGGGGGESGLSVPVSANAVGDAASVPFLVNTSSVSVSYAYDCSSTGGSGFTGDLISGSASNPGSDDEEFASESGVSDSVSDVTVNLQAAPGDYFIQVSSPCAWTVTVGSG